jgi:hypothetical protein
VKWRVLKSQGIPGALKTTMKEHLSKKEGALADEIIVKSTINCNKLQIKSCGLKKYYEENRPISIV